MFNYQLAKTQTLLCPLKGFLSSDKQFLSLKIYIYHAPVAQLVEHRAAMQEVVSLTPAGPTLRVLK